MTNESKGVRAPQPAAGSRGLHRYARLLVAATFILIFAGGLVTSTGSALAVPDWPLSFGKFFPKMEGGVLYEHGHRMIAGTVALMTLGLAIWAWRRESRRFVRNLALLSFGLVIVQAVLGGLTVLLLLPLAIAVSHAATAQAFFCLIVALALFTNPAWQTLPAVTSVGERPRLPLLAAVTTAVIYSQILIGAVMRHMGAGLAIPDFPLAFGKVVPSLESLPEQINFAHRRGRDCGQRLCLLDVDSGAALLSAGFFAAPPGGCDVGPAGAADYPGCDDDLDRSRSDSDHFACGGGRRPAGHQPGPDAAGISID